MNNLNTHKNKTRNLFFFIFHFLFFLFFNSLVTDKNLKIIGLLILIVVFQTFIFYLFNFDFVFFVTFFMSYLLMPLTLVYFNLLSKSIGLISLNLIPIHIEKCIIYVYIFIFTFSIVSYVFNFQIHERIILNKKSIPLSNLTITINNLIVVFSTIIAFPRLSLSVSNASDRFRMLLPGHAWNQLAIVAIVFNLPYIRKKKSVMMSTLFAITWFSLNGERADISGLILGIFILSLLSEKISKRYKKFFVLTLFVAVIILITIGNIRIQGGNINIYGSLQDIATFSTVSDISYLLNVCVDYTYVVGHTGGKMILELISYVVPFTNRGGLSLFINSFYANPGGTPLIGPAIMDFGTIGILIYTSIQSMLVTFLAFHKNSNILRYELIVLICLIPRICWYGINFAFPSLVFFVPIVYFINILINYVSLSYGND